MSDVIYDNVKLVVEFAPKEGAPESGETVQELFGKTAGHITDTEIHTTAAEKSMWNSLSNPNLLINPDWRVNTSGETEYHGTTAIMDCWGTATENTVKYLDGGARVIDDGTASWNYLLSQSVKDFAPLRGRTVTFSVKIREITGRALLQMCDGVNRLSSEVFTAPGTYHVTAAISADATQLECILVHGLNEAVDVTADWMKLELGTCATSFKAPMYSDEVLRIKAQNGDIGNATSVDSTNHKARLYEDPEGGNLRLESPNGAMSMEMDMYDNKSFRIYFERNGELVFPFLYNSIYNDFEISKLNGARITSVGVKRGYITSAIADVITYGDRVVHKLTSDTSYIGWTTTSDGWFAPVFVSRTVEGTRFSMNGYECMYSVGGEKCGSFSHNGETYYACWNNPASLINPLVSTSALYVALSGDDYISACKTLINICEGLCAAGGNADTLGNRSPEDFANTCNGSLDLYLSGKSGDIRALAHLLPPGGFSADTSWFTDVIFPMTGTILLTWARSSYKADDNIYLYGVLIVRPLASTGDTYICSVYNTSLYTDWQRLSDGGNATSVGTYTESKIAELEARIAALESKS